LAKKTLTYFLKSVYMFISKIIRSGSPAMPGMKREPGVNPGQSGYCKWGAAPKMPLGFLNSPGRRDVCHEPRVRKPYLDKTR